MILTERHIFTKNSPLYKELDNLCFLSKNLYNSALYAIRQHYFTEKQYLPYVKLNNKFVAEKQTDYYALPCKVAQQTLKLADQNMKSFFGALKTKNSKPRLPKYLDKTNGRFVVTYTNQAISHKALKNGVIEPSKTNLHIKTHVQNVRQVRIVPANNVIIVEVVYNKPAEERQFAKRKYCGVDFGLNNLMACAFAEERPLLFNGRPLKSMNRYFNKTKAALQSKLHKGKHTSRRIDRLTIQRNNKVADYLHKVSRMFVNHLVSNEVSDVIIGYNKEWKQGINIGKANNQQFVGIPYYKLLNMLTYKCKLLGINVIVTEESYTSKCSFLDDEEVRKHEEYSGRRVKRGLFRASDGRCINADVNGALNIMKKVLGEYYYDPILVCSMPLVLKP